MADTGEGSHCSFCRFSKVVLLDYTIYFTPSRINLQSSVSVEILVFLKPQTVGLTSLCSPNWSNIHQNLNKSVDLRNNTRLCHWWDWSSWKLTGNTDVYVPKAIVSNSCHQSQYPKRPLSKCLSDMYQHAASARLLPFSLRSAHHCHVIQLMCINTSLLWNKRLD